MNIFHRPWGSFEDLKTDKNWHLKIINVFKGKRLSLQSHKLRDELWVTLKGKGVAEVEDLKTKKMIKHILSPMVKVLIPRKAKHRLSGASELKVAEIRFGKFNENDIERYEDDFGRI